MRTKREKGEIITLDDCEKVIKSYVNVITPEMLLRFQAYDTGVSYEDLIEALKRKG